MKSDDSDWPYDFSPEEWEICLAVLQKVGRAPNDVPDLERMKTLVTKVYKTAKKMRGQEAQAQSRKADADKLAATQRQQDAKSHHQLPSEYRETQMHTEAVTLHRARRCYVCHQKFQNLHPHYHRMCFDCGQISYQQRVMSLDLSGRIALVTGGRIKLGQAVVLRLLRAGARVIATTRFPVNAAAVYSAQPDYSHWQDRLEIIGLDLLRLGELERLSQQLTSYLPHLDILINNAAQTLWRPPDYYQPLLAAEHELQARIDPQLLSPLQAKTIGDPLKLSVEEVSTSATGSQGISSILAAYWQQEPADPRPINSWILELEAIPAREILEVQVINAVAPAMLCSQLKALMLRSPFTDRHIVNVSSSEGQFDYHLKQTTHAHTNMSKASLNMLTRTVAEHYAADQIYMNSVDVGWVSAETPEPDNLHKEAAGFVPPLDAHDGAARMTHPIAEAMAGRPVWGHLLKDFQTTDW